MTLGERAPTERQYNLVIQSVDVRVTISVTLTLATNWLYDIGHNS